MKKLPQFLSFVATCIIGFAIHYWFGDFGLLRAMGAFFAIGGIVMIFAPQIEIGAIGFEGAQVGGWPKIFAIVPMLVFGCGAMWFAPEITCISYKQKNSEECKQYFAQKLASPTTSPAKPTPL